MRKMWRCLGLFCFAISIGLALSQHSLAANNSDLVGFLKPVPSSVHGRTLIVFVHGVIGETLNAWKADRSTTSFPELVMADATQFRNVDVFVFGYDTPVLSSTATIEGTALGDFSDKLRTGARIDRYGRVAFVAHSMGGLVLREYLLGHPEIARKTLFAYSYSTPFGGAEIATVANIFSANPQLGQMVGGRGNADKTLYVNSLRVRWTNSEHTRSVPTYCAAETLRTFGVMVVSTQSAFDLCNRGMREIGGTDHMTIAKPVSRSSASYSALSSAFAESVASQSGNSPLERLMDAARAGDGYAALLLATYFERGEGGFTQSVPDAIRWYTVAANKQISDAYNPLGRLLMRTAITIEQQTYALSMLTNAVRSGVPDSNFEVGTFFRSDSLISARDLKVARSFFRRGIALGCGRCQGALVELDATP
jgi:hypothetical protein